MKKCMACNKKIGEKEHYFEVTEFKNKGVIGKKYVHKNCQDTYDKMLTERMISPEMKDNFTSALAKANDLLTKMGGEEVVYIK